MLNDPQLLGKKSADRFDLANPTILSPSKKHSQNSIAPSQSIPKKGGLRLELDSMLQLAKNRPKKSSSITKKHAPNFGYLGKRSVV